MPKCEGGGRVGQPLGHSADSMTTHIWNHLSGSSRTQAEVGTFLQCALPRELAGRTPCSQLRPPPRCNGAPALCAPSPPILRTEVVSRPTCSSSLQSRYHRSLERHLSHASAARKGAPHAPPSRELHAAPTIVTNPGVCLGTDCCVISWWSLLRSPASPRAPLPALLPRHRPRALLRNLQQGGCHPGLCSLACIPCCEHTLQIRRGHGMCARSIAGEPICLPIAIPHIPRNAALAGRLPIEVGFYPTDFRDAELPNRRRPVPKVRMLPSGHDPTSQVLCSCDDEAAVGPNTRVAIRPLQGAN